MPKDRFELGILVPLREEFRYVTEVAPQLECISYAGTHFYRLDFGEISAVCCLVDDMGPLSAANATNRLLEFAEIKLLVLLGTAGALDDEISVGDVVVAAEINEFQANSKAESAGDSYEVRYSGRHWPLEFGIRQAITHFEFSARRAFECWQNAASKDYDALNVPAKERVCSAPPSLRLGSIASGTIVAASKAFTAEVKRINRKFIAIDMEAAGLAFAASERINPLPHIVVRGISDLADESKTLLDKGSKNAWRRYSVRNATSLLRNLLTWDGFLDATKLSKSAGFMEDDIVHDLATRLKNEIGGLWAIGVAFGLYAYGLRITSDHRAVPTDLTRLCLADENVRNLLKAFDEEKERVLAHRDSQAAAEAFSAMATRYRAQLDSADAIELLKDFDKVVSEILFPNSMGEDVDSLLLQADRLEEDIGVDAALELLKHTANEHPLVRERYVDALASKNMWREVVETIGQVDISNMSRRELENGIFACAKVNNSTFGKLMLERHISTYDDGAARLFRQQVMRQNANVNQRPASNQT